MSIIKRLKWKDKSGKTTDYDLGAKASNVEQDATHRFVSDMEKQTWNGKADPGDIPSGAAADYGVANNDTTNRADMLSTAQVAYQHGKEIDQLNSDLGGLTFAQDAEGNWGYIPRGADAVVPFRNIIVRASTSYLTSAYEGHVRVQIRVSVYDGETLLVTDTIFDGHARGSGSGSTTETIYP